MRLLVGSGNNSKRWNGGGSRYGMSTQMMLEYKMLRDRSRGGCCWRIVCFGGEAEQ